MCENSILNDGVYLVVLAKIQGEIAFCRRLAKQCSPTSDDAKALSEIADFLEHKARLVDQSRLEPFQLNG